MIKAIIDADGDIALTVDSMTITCQPDEALALAAEIIQLVRRQMKADQMKAFIEDRR